MSPRIDRTFGRGVFGLIGQVLDLVGDDGEGAALFTRGGRLDGGVERQEIRLPAMSVTVAMISRCLRLSR